MEDVQQRKLLSALCHGAIFFSSTLVSVLIPIAILFTTEDTVIKRNAKESLNFHINIYLYAIFCISFWLLPFLGIIISFPLLLLLAALSLIMPIVAIVRVLEDPSKAYCYPFIFHII
jgi:uncharacterized protein